MLTGSGNNPQLATNSGGGGGASLSISNQKRNLGGFNRIIFSVINNYMLSFSSFQRGSCSIDNTKLFTPQKNGWIKCSSLKFLEQRDVVHRIRVPSVLISF